MSTNEGPDRAAAGGASGAERGSGRSSSRGFVPKGAPRRTASTTRERRRTGSEYTGEERLMLLDTWFRSQLPASEFAQLVGVSAQTLSVWKRPSRRRVRRP